MTSKAAATNTRISHAVMYALSAKARIRITGLRWWNGAFTVLARKPIVTQARIAITTVHALPTKTWVRVTR